LSAGRSGVSVNNWASWSTVSASITVVTTVTSVVALRGLVADEVNLRLGGLGWSWGGELDGWGGIGLLEQNVDEGLLFWCWGQV
jgi:hypothetical protein